VAAAWAAAWTETEAILQDSKGTSFSSDEVRRDELGLGTCEPARFPSWLAAAAERLRTRWNFDQMHMGTSLRGKKRDQLGHWLRGP